MENPFLVLEEASVWIPLPCLLCVHTLEKLIKRQFFPVRLLWRNAQKGLVK